MPGLIVNILFCGLVLGPFVTTLSLVDYFTSKELYTFLLSVFLFPLNLTLPGVFRASPDGAGVSGPLYTLTMEAVAYLVIFLLGTSRVQLRIQLLLLLLPLLYIHRTYTFTHLDEASLKFYGVSLFYLPYKEAIPAFLCFTIGALIQVLPPRIARSRLLAACAFGAYCLACQTPYYRYVEVFAVPIVTIYIGLSTWRLSAVTDRIGDLSYGVYIYHSPIQKAVYDSLHESLNPVLLLLTALFMTYLAAASSYHFVEKPALSLKRRSSKTKDFRSQVRLYTPTAYKTLRLLMTRSPSRKLPTRFGDMPKTRFPTWAVPRHKSTDCKSICEKVVHKTLIAALNRTLELNRA